jgi:surface antigen
MSMWSWRVRTGVVVAACLVLPAFSFVGFSVLTVTPAAATSATRLCDGYAACSTGGFTTNGYQNASGTSYWEMDAGDECTNYVAFVESTVYDVPTPDFNLGNGGDWAANASENGIVVNDTPSVGAVAEWNGGDYGMSDDGHVAVVERVGPDDSYIVVSQQHISIDVDGYDWEQIDADAPADQWEPWPNNFIHFSGAKIPVFDSEVGIAATSDGGGYRTVNQTGAITSEGDAAPFGTPAATISPAVGIQSAPGDGGGWVVAANGAVFTYGTAAFHGSLGNMTLNAPIVGMAATPDGGGYWLVASDGGMFAFGDAKFYGSLAGMHLNAPVVGMAATPDAGGYWLVTADGGVFAFGDATFDGSLGNVQLNAPIVGMAAGSQAGYWLVGSDGGVFAFGGVPFDGSMAGAKLDAPIAGMAAAPNGGGYWLLTSDNGIFTFGDAGFFGSDPTS